MAEFRVLKATSILAQYVYCPCPDGEDIFFRTARFFLSLSDSIERSGLAKWLLIFNGILNHSLSSSSTLSLVVPLARSSFAGILFLWCCFSELKAGWSDQKRSSANDLYHLLLANDVLPPPPPKSGRLRSLVRSPKQTRDERSAEAGVDRDHWRLTL